MDASNSKNSLKPVATGGTFTKSLITPCRRLGLSKKYKSNAFKSPLIQQPVQLPFDPFEKSPVLTQEPIAVKTEVERQSKNEVKKPKSDDFRGFTEKPRNQVKKRLIESSSDEEIEKESKLNVSGCEELQVEENCNNEDKVKIKGSECKELYVSVKKLENSKTNKLSDKSKLTENNTEIENSVSTKNKTKAKRKIVVYTGKKDKQKENKEINTPTNENDVTTTSVEDLESKPILEQEKPEPKRKSSFDDYIKKKEKLKSNSKSLSSKLSLKKSTNKSDSIESDEEFFKEKSQSSERKTIDKSELITKIVKLEKLVDDKENELDKYKQAEKYHKIHDVEKLEALSKVWKNGCEGALEDLLKKLQEHGTIDMPTLLKNLRAPEELIKYNVEDGVFV